MVRTWTGFTADDWTRPSRNADWTMHLTARHVADAMQAGTASVCGEPAPFAVGAFDPNSTPDDWLRSSAHESPAATIDRFTHAAEQLRHAVGTRMAAGDQSQGATVYGPAHWTVMVVHLLWDSWLHERDILLPLGRTPASTPDEDRLAVLYGLLMAMLPSRMTGETLTVTIGLDGPAPRTVMASCRGDQIEAAEVRVGDATDTTAELVADPATLTDALSGRGRSLTEICRRRPRHSACSPSSCGPDAYRASAGGIDARRRARSAARYTSPSARMSAPTDARSGSSRNMISDRRSSAIPHQ
ncbi:MAG: hypothetical protein R2695_22230 [Acidimicrobiales bacterium]